VQVFLKPLLRRGKSEKLIRRIKAFDGGNGRPGRPGRPFAIPH
jgi:hypothetical protein